MYPDYRVTFTSKKHSDCTIQYAKVSDAEELTRFINTFSKEDLFTRFAGEQLSIEEEKEYLQSEVKAIEAGDNVKLFCWVDGKIGGVCDVHRDTSLLTRKRHCGILGLIVAKEFRGEGIGYRLITETLHEAIAQIPGLKIIKLSCFANNTTALSLYQKVGFTEVARIPKVLWYRNEYIDEVIMTSEITSVELLNFTNHLSLSSE